MHAEAELIAMAGAGLKPAPFNLILKGNDMKLVATVSMLMVIVAFSCIGCTKQAAKQQPGVMPAPHVVTVPAFARPAVAAVGGERAWGNTQVILGECVVKYYRPGGSFYLTRQRHAVYPWSDSIRIYASEPQGTFVWQLTGTNFTLLEGTPQQAAELPITLCGPAIAQALWSIMAAPASIATQTDANSAGPGQAVRIAGLWHYPVKLSKSQTWYLSKDTDIFDIYQLGVSGKPVILIVRGYDYRTIEKTNIMVPAKVEIFTATTAESELQRIVEYNYHTLESRVF
jgi:hypothetical protein